MREILTKPPELSDEAKLLMVMLHKERGEHFSMFPLGTNVEVFLSLIWHYADPEIYDVYYEGYCHYDSLDRSQLGFIKTRGTVLINKRRALEKDPDFDWDFTFRIRVTEGYNSYYLNELYFVNTFLNMGLGAQRSRRKHLRIPSGKLDTLVDRITSLFITYFDWLIYHKHKPVDRKEFIVDYEVKGFGYLKSHLAALISKTKHGYHKFNSKQKVKRQRRKLLVKQRLNLEY